MWKLVNIFYWEVLLGNIWFVFPLLIYSFPPKKIQLRAGNKYCRTGEFWSRKAVVLPKATGAGISSWLLPANPVCESPVSSSVLELWTARGSPSQIQSPVQVQALLWLQRVLSARLLPLPIPTEPPQGALWISFPIKSSSGQLLTSSLPCNSGRLPASRFLKCILKRERFRLGAKMIFCLSLYFFPPLSPPSFSPASLLAELWLGCEVVGTKSTMLISCCTFQLVKPW